MRGAEYVCGFLIDNQDRVVLVRKSRPSWQAGLLNGVGGKWESGETGCEAMRREFLEETGLDVAGWEEIVWLLCNGRDAVTFFRAFGPPHLLDEAASMTDEPIEVHRITDLLRPGAGTIPNLRWLLPFAAHVRDRYIPLLVEEQDAAVATPAVTVQPPVEGTTKK